MRDLRIRIPEGFPEPKLRRRLQTLHDVGLVDDPAVGAVNRPADLGLGANLFEKSLGFRVSCEVTPAEAWLKSSSRSWPIKRRG